MAQNISKKNVIRIAGAYVAWVMGSGFATGQEILQFITSFDFHSYAIMLIVLFGFILVGPTILQVGSLHRNNPDFNHFNFFCGDRLGWFYSWFLPISLFAGMIILVSGAGATLEEYYGINHYVGALLMATLALIAYVVGFQRFVKVVSFIGPTIIAFTLLIGIVTLVRDFDNLVNLNQYTSDAVTSSAMEAKQSSPFWWLSSFLYISYNLCGGSKYYTALGMTSPSIKEAKIGGIVGTLALMASILLINSAMLTHIDQCAVLGVPTLYLTRLINYALGAVFSIILIMGIFSSCSAMLWTCTEKLISERIVKRGSKANYIAAALICLVAFLIGLLPFADLIGVIYTISGYIGFIFIACVIRYRFSKE